jgi:hypothetical protein
MPAWLSLGVVIPICALAFGVFGWWQEWRPRIVWGKVGPVEANRLRVEVRNTGRAAAEGVRFEWSTNAVGPAEDNFDGAPVVELVVVESGIEPNFLPHNEPHIITFVAPHPFGLFFVETFQLGDDRIIGRMVIRFRGVLGRERTGGFQLKAAVSGRQAAGLDEATVEALSDRDGSIWSRLRRRINIGTVPMS